MESETVLYERQGEIGFLTFNRPHVLNALSDQLLRGFLRRLRQAQDDERAKVVILSGAGRAFCAGADVSEASARETVDDEYDRIKMLQRVAYDMLTFDKATVAAIQGYALGGGLELALLCDIRIAAKDAKFGFPEADVGSMVTTAGTFLLPRLIGLGRAKAMVLTAEMIDAYQAEKWGLVTSVVPLDSLRDFAEDVASKLAAKPKRTLHLLRTVIDRNMDSTYAAALELEQLACCYCFASGENLDAMKDQLARIKKKKS